MKRPKVTNLDTLTKLLADRQKELVALIAKGEPVNQEDYITTAHHMNGLVVEYILEPKWYDIKNDKYQPKLTPRGRFYYKEYLKKKEGY